MENEEQKMKLFSKKIKPLVIGVCGRSCSGKSAVVKELEEKYKGKFLHINQDKFFKKTADNWERPDSLRIDRLIYSIKKLKEGKSTHIPSHRWTEVFDKEVKPHEVIIVEGYLLFVNEELSGLFDKKIWVDVSDANIVYRRTKRDGTSKYLDYTMNVVIPESKKYEEIQRKRAGVIIDGNKNKEEIIQDFEELLNPKMSLNSNFNKCQNMLLGTAIGDAFGAGYEGKSRAKILETLNINKLSNSGKYTDDTQMSIAVAELLVSNKKFTKENLADKFVEVYKRDIHKGYSSTREEILKKSKRGKEFLDLHKGRYSRANGACMRAVPIGVIPNMSTVINYAKINAETTHNTPGGIISSVCISLASHYFYYNLGKPEDIFDFCISNSEGLDKTALDYLKGVRDMKYFDPKIIFGKEHEKYGVPCDGVKTIGAVLYLLSKYSESSKQILKEAVLLGGDADSVASIALGIASIKSGIKEIPPQLFYGLENGKYGRNYLIKLGEELFKK